MGKRGRPPKPIGKDTGDAIATPSIEEKATEKEDPEVSNKKSPTGCATPIQPQPDLEIEELIATEEEAEDKSEEKKATLMLLADQRANSSNTNLAKFEKELTQELHQKLRASFLMKCQQSKADWITYGDQDTKLFHAWVKKRRAQTHLTAIAKEDGEVVEGKTKVAKVLVEFYQNQLGRTMETEDINPNIISMGNTLSIDQQLALIAPITPDEIKTSLFEIPNNKSPEPDDLTGPAVMAAASIAVGLRGVLLHVAIVQAALPQGIVPFVFAKEYGVHPDILSPAVIFGMLIALPITLVYYILLGL
ncbi:unnamed protein product [Cuscuta campestris]|uniref:Uncharacterized protein n=1 Tax=Cuscuta campestris TaxID=132261 RepID=A0A484KPC1_9ASTE|nr:unnamed protein product [Cuscuta campestris]